MKKAAHLLLTFIAFSVVSNAQILNPKKILQRKSEERVNQKIENGVDKALDKVFGGFGKKSSSENTSDDAPQNENEAADPSEALGKLFGKLGNAAPPQGSYSFSSSYVMQLKSTSNKKDENYTMQMKYMFNNEGKVMGSKMISSDNPEMNKQLDMVEAMIFDWDKGQMYSFMNMNGQKQYMGIALKDGTIGDAMEGQYEKTTFTKLGKTRTIAGYLCEAYLNDDGKNQYTVWISEDKVPAVARYYDSFNKMSSSQKNQLKMAYQSNPEMLKLVQEGRAMMGMETTDKNTKTEMEVVKVSPSDNFTFNTSGYTSMMDMNAIMKQSEQQNKN